MARLLPSLPPAWRPSLRRIGALVRWPLLATLGLLAASAPFDPTPTQMLLGSLGAGLTMIAIQAWWRDGTVAPALAMAWVSERLHGRPHAPLMPGLVLGPEGLELRVYVGTPWPDAPRYLYGVRFVPILAPGFAPAPGPEGHVTPVTLADASLTASPDTPVLPLRRSETTSPPPLGTPHGLTDLAALPDPFVALAALPSEDPGARTAAAHDGGDAVAAPSPDAEDCDDPLAVTLYRPRGATPLLGDPLRRALGLPHPPSAPPPAREIRRGTLRLVR